MVTVKRGESNMELMAPWVRFVWAINRAVPDLIRAPRYLGEGVEIYPAMVVVMAPELNRASFIPRTERARAALEQAALAWEGAGEWIERS